MSLPGPDAPARSASPGADLEQRIAAVGADLSTALQAVLAALPDRPQGPQQVARSLGLDKVLTSRLLKAARSRDPMAVSYHAPGPEPLRRFLRAARRHGVAADLVHDGERAVDAFEQLVRQEVGDRSALDALISAWLPEARTEFELRRKQSAYKAMSQLKGVTANTSLSTVLLHPAADGLHLDVVWVFGLLGLTRLRSGVAVKFSTRRIVDAAGRPRQPRTLDGDTVEDLGGLRLDAFCDAPPAEVEVHAVGDCVHYTLGGDDFGPGSDVDLVMAEANLAEMLRFVPAGSGRKGYVFAEVVTPCRVLLFDVLVHRDVYPGREPVLLLYDTVLDGVADVNDRARDIDRFEMAETITSLGTGPAKFRVAGVPHYVDLTRHVFERTGWDGEQFRGYRCRIDYPLYGSQVVMAFDPPPPSDG